MKILIMLALRRMSSASGFGPANSGRMIPKNVETVSFASEHDDPVADQEDRYDQQAY